MEYKEIKRLMDDMGESKLNEIEIDFPDGTKIKIKKGVEAVSNTSTVIPVVNQVQPIEQAKVEVKPEVKAVEGKIVTSPMVGTFYSRPAPTAEPFVQVGTKVKRGDKLCIIEAMKLMNEIESEWDGEIVEILVNEEELVDYGKPLFRIK